MANHSNTMSMPKATIQHPGAVKPLDPDDPNEVAFKLVIAFVFSCVMKLLKKLLFLPFFCPNPATLMLDVMPLSCPEVAEYGISICNAMCITKAMHCSSSLYQRVDCYHQQKAEEELMACPLS